MNIERLKVLAGIITESKLTLEQELAALEAQHKAEVDPRARSTLKRQIAIIKNKIAEKDL